MGRIRTIKPEFPQSESMGRVSRDARLLFVELWTLADDSGRARAASRMLASLLFPYDDDAPGLIDTWLGELEREKCLVRYIVDGQHYIEISNFLRHQKIDHPSPSKFPAPETSREDSRGISEDSRKIALDQGSGIKDQGTGTHTDSRELSTGKYPEEIYKAWHSIGDKVIQPSSMIDFLTRIYGVEIHPIIRGIHSDDVLQAVRNFGKVVSGPPGRYWWTRKIGVGVFFQKHLDKFIPANFAESDFLVDQKPVETGPPKSINGYDARDKTCEECGGTIIGTLDCCPRCGWAPGQDRTDPGMQEFYKRNLSRHKVAV